MKINYLAYTIAIFLGSFLLLQSCSKMGSGRTKTASGLEYVFHKQTPNAKKPQTNDFLSLQMRYSLDKNDSLLYNSFGNPKPLSFRLQKSLFRGALNEGLTLMGEGDSATLWIVADSLYGQGRLPRYIKPGEKVKYTIALKKVQSSDEYEKATMQQMTAQNDADKAIIEKYIADKKLNATLNPETKIYAQITQQGTQPLPPNVQRIKGNYTLKLTNGEVIEKVDGQPQVIETYRLPRGFREGIQLIKKGGKGTIILPSGEGFGIQQRGNIPPNSVLIYEISIADFELPTQQSTAPQARMTATPQQQQQNRTVRPLLNNPKNADNSTEVKDGK